ncbi:Nucleolar protein 58 [Rhizina undulata]
MWYTAGIARGDYPCNHSPALPTNVTRRRNLPNSNFDLIALAPWISVNCSTTYLKAVDEENVAIKGFIFYAKDPQAAMPSSENVYWKGVLYKEFDFPVYAIDALEGLPLINKVVEYSGNLSEIWEKNDLTLYYDSRDYARVFVQVDTGASRVIRDKESVAGIVAPLAHRVGRADPHRRFDVVSMHLIQYRRRVTLRRRVARREVNLEALGIKRLMVPRHILETFSLRLYVPVPRTPPRVATAQEASQMTPGMQRSIPPREPTELAPSTLIRELPCLHVFREDSSTLPRGYVPPNLTNATVRRERNMRRLRARVDSDGCDTSVWDKFCIWRLLIARVMRGERGGNAEGTRRRRKEGREEGHAESGE